MTDIFITRENRRDLAFTVSEKLRVREFVPVKNLAGSSHHTAIVLNNTEKDGPSIPLLVDALMRSGFPHVIVRHGAYNRETSEHFITRYLVGLSDMSSSEAVAWASAKVNDKNTEDLPFVLYGYVGMNEEEKVEFASTIYAEQLNEAISSYQEERYPQALQKMIHALSVIQYADNMQDFGELSKLAVDAAYKIGDYQTAIFLSKAVFAVIGCSSKF